MHLLNLHVLVHLNLCLCSQEPQLSIILRSSIGVSQNLPSVLYSQEVLCWCRVWRCCLVRVQAEGGTAVGSFNLLGAGF